MADTVDITVTRATLEITANPIPTGYLTQAVADTLYEPLGGGSYQPLDGDLTAIAALASTGLARRTGTDTWTVGTTVSVAEGGTGSTSASTARTALGLAIGTDVQAYDAGLASLAALPTVADRLAYSTAADTWAETSLTAYARTLLDDADAATTRATLGVGYVTQTLTDAASISWDASSGEHGTVTITADRALANPSNLVSGRLYSLRVTQDSTGGWALTVGSTFDRPPRLYEAAGAVTTVVWWYDGTTLHTVGEAPPPAEVVIVSRLVSNAGSGSTQWTNMPAALTELSGGQNFRALVDLRSATEIQLTGRIAGVAGVAGSVLAGAYSTDGGSTWYWLDGSGAVGASITTQEPQIPIDTTWDRPVSPWISIASGARVESVLLTLYGYNGNGVADPALETLLWRVR